ncbi:hypothetical protein [Profundibacter sp.]|uniref:hypothetical protein n=1 Tax=Profundibacter sp. TaxID=3101071 RepID=UPI003D117E81
MPQRKTRVIAAGVVIGLAGYFSMIGFVWSDCYTTFSSCYGSADEVILPVIVGAGLAGMLFYALFGQQGRKGWLLAALGAVLATAVGAMLAVLVMGLWGGEGVLNDLSVVLGTSVNSRFRLLRGGVDGFSPVPPDCFGS